MKTIKLLVLVTLAFAVSDINAQKPITLGEDSLMFGNVKLPCLVVNIPEVNYEKTQKNWIKTLQTGTKSKVVNENGEMTMFGAIIKQVAPNPVNVYSEMMNRDSVVSLMVAFELKKDEYIEAATGDAMVTQGKSFLKKFAKDEYLDLVKDQLSAENKKLKGLENDLKSLQNEKNRLQKSIQSSRTSITKEKDNIVLQNNEVAKLTPEILEMSNQILGMEEGAAKEEKASYIKDLEKRKKKALNEVESSENKITKENNQIDKADREIPKNESEQQTLIGKIAIQETVVQSFEDKLRTVEGY